MRHRFAAILAADVAQFSRLMEGDSEATVRALRECRQIFGSCVSVHHGQEFGSVGDSLMAEFPSPVEALRAARDIHTTLSEAKPVFDGGERLRVRIGLHAGDVIVDGDNLFGDVVNSASRLQEIAQPGGIALSAFVQEQVRKERGFSFRSLGLHRLKNIVEPIHVFEVERQPKKVNWRRLRFALLDYKAPAAALFGAIVAGAIVIGYLESRAPGVGSVIEVTADAQRRPVEANSITVMPLDNLSGEPEQDFFADEMTGILIAGLAKVDGLLVRRKPPLGPDESENEPLEKIAEELGVRAVVEGSTKWADDVVHLNLQVVDVASDQVLWAEHYRRNITEIFQLRSDVATAVAESLAIELSPSIEGRLIGGRPVVAEAFRFWLIGNQHLKVMDADKALRAFEHAIEEDPKFAAAYAGIAQVHTLRGSWHGDRPVSAVIADARAAAERAIRLDPDLAEAHFALATTHLLDWDWESAHRAFMKGSESNPTDSLGLVQYANFLGAMGRYDESVEVAMRAVAIDPLSPGTRNELAGALWMAGREADGVAEFQGSNAT